MVERFVLEEGHVEFFADQARADVLRQQALRLGDWKTTLQWMASLACDDAYVPQAAEALA